MGYMSHNAIVVTGSTADRDGELAGKDFAALHDVCAKACGEALSISPVFPSPSYGYLSFMVGPDGAKESRPESDDGDTAREAIRGILRSAPMYSGIDWAEIQYGNDDCVTLIVDHSDKLAEDA